MTNRPRYFGRCRACGDEWTERTPPAICPECHSLDVVDVTAEHSQEELDTVRPEQ